MILNIFLFLGSIFAVRDDTSGPFNFKSDTLFFSRYKQMLVDIREQNITPEQAKTEFISIMEKLRGVYPNHIDDDTLIVFPMVKTYANAVGGKGKGFYARTFNLFDFKVKGSHPAHDIFIYDPDQDCIDNRKKSYVDVVSVGEGLVIATEDAWYPDAPFKGGNYVWVYDVVRGSLWYYAHLRQVDVKVGQIVKAGDKLGQVGRTGSSAYNKRSDTHLHLMHLKLLDDLSPKPHNYYKWLLKAKVLQQSEEADVFKKVEIE